ncbi:MAG: hypothetical protein PHU85_20685, partial [Phycisphaerae bacterium]|nr:hypothetical protein [Phycisphaerae bacterium]
AIDGPIIWAADDQTLFRIDPRAAENVQRFTAAEGLPDEAIQAMAVAGDDLWLITRGGLARLDRKSGRADVSKDIRFNIAAITVGGNGVWLVSDAGAWMTPLGKQQWKKLPDFPGQPDLAQFAQRGFWYKLWSAKTRLWLPWLHANADGLYAIAMNRLVRYDPTADKWATVCGSAWMATAQGRTIWAVGTNQVVRYDGQKGTSETFQAGRAQAAGRAVGQAADDKAFYLVSQPDYDAKADKFVGGGISKLDLATGKWTVTESVDGTDIRFCQSVLAGSSGGDWAACKLYDRVVQFGAHPGMAHIKKFVPHATGIGVLHAEPGGKWTLTKLDNLKTESAWVLGQRGTATTDKIGADAAIRLCCADRKLWAIIQCVPEDFYSGYSLCVGSLMRNPPPAAAWQAGVRLYSDDTASGSEQPDVLLLSGSHGPEFVLGEGCPDMLGMEPTPAGLVVVNENGVFAQRGDSFAPLLRENFRVYWAGTCAAPSDSGVWFGGDSGTISKLDRKTGRVELVGLVPKSKVVSIFGGIATVADAPVVLPRGLTAKDMPAVDKSVTLEPAASARPGVCDYVCKGNYLCKGDTRVAFLRGVFKPAVLCADPVANRIWLSTYDGLASIPMPADK